MSAKSGTPKGPEEALPAGPKSCSAAMLMEHPFVNGLTTEQVRLLADYSMLVRFERNELILEEGDPANRFYLIRSGKVAIECFKGRQPSVIEVLGPGQALGWSWIFPPYLWRFSARSLEPTNAIFFYATPLRELCELNHHLGYELMKRAAEVMIERLNATRRTLAAVGFGLNRFESRSHRKD